MSNEQVEAQIGETSAAKKMPLGLMNKPTLLANKNLRVADDEDQSAFGNPANFDPMSVLSNTRVD